MKKDMMRHSITDEDIAALLMRGQLNLSHCEERPELRIAVEGIFEEFEWMDLGTGQKRVEAKQDFRAVVEHRSPKSVVVTVYSVRPAFDYDVPLIDREIW